MSQQNLETARALLEPFTGVNAAAIDWDSEAVRELMGRHFSAEVELEHFATGLDTRTYRGRDGVFQWLREWFEPFEEYHSQPLEFIEAGESVVVPTRQWGVGEASGAAVEVEVTWACQFRDHQVVRLTTHDTAEEALEAAGRE